MTEPEKIQAEQRGAQQRRIELQQEQIISLETQLNELRQERDQWKEQCRATAEGGATNIKLITEQSSLLSELAGALEKVKEKCHHDSQDLCLTPSGHIPCFCFVGEALTKFNHWKERGIK